MAVYGGLQPWGTVLHASLYPLSASEGNDLYKGDPIAMDTTGYATISSDSNQMLGAALAFYDSAMNPIKYYPNASYAVVCYVLVADAADQEFIMAEDADTSQIAITDMGGNIAFAAATGDTTTGLSAYTLDSNTVASTVSLPFKLLRLAPVVGNSLYSATLCPNPKWIGVMGLAVKKSPISVTT